MNDWYPLASGQVRFGGCGPHVFGPYRGVLHTTEGSSAAGALATYGETGNYPHFTIGELGAVWQHCALSVGSTALKHPAGTIDTNRASAIQIEIVGFAAQSANLPDAQAGPLSALMRWIEAQTGIERMFADFRGARFSPGTWQTFNGWCGHMHVPNNDHTDPGNIAVAKLGGAGSSPAPAPAPAPAPGPTNDYSVEADVASMPVVKQGDTGQFARILQGLLVANGRKVAVDGIAGPETIGALREWQSACHLTANGICDPVTWRRLLCV